MLIMNSSASPSQEIPIECESLYFKRKLHNVPPKVNVALVSSLVLNCVTFPFTVVLNLLVIAAVKTRQRLRTNSNVVIACLETTDLLVGVFVQPFYFPVVMSVISTLEGDLSSTTCLIRLTFSNGLGMFCGASLFQLVLMTVERLLAIFRPYSHNVGVTERRIVAASIVAWVVNLLFTIIYLVFKVKFLFPVLAIFWLSLVIIIVGQFILYREARRHKTQIRAQQVAVKMESRQKFEKEKKALKLTTYVVLTMLLFYFPHNCYSARSFQGFIEYYIYHFIHRRVYSNIKFGCQSNNLCCEIKTVSSSFPRNYFKKKVHRGATDRDAIILYPQAW